MKRILFSSILLSVAYGLIAILLQNLASPGIFASVILLTLSVVLTTKLVFVITDSIFPQPSNLTIEDVKSFLLSKMFWLAALNLIATMLDGLFGITLDLDTQQEVLQLDWTNVFRALVSVGLIAIRKFDILKLLT